MRSDIDTDIQELDAVNDDWIADDFTVATTAINELVKEQTQ